MDNHSIENIGFDEKQPAMIDIDHTSKFKHSNTNVRLVHQSQREMFSSSLADHSHRKKDIVDDLQGLFSSMNTEAKHREEDHIFRKETTTAIGKYDQKTQNDFD